MNKYHWSIFDLLMNKYHLFITNTSNFINYLLSHFATNNTKEKLTLFTSVASVMKHCFNVISFSLLAHDLHQL